jgi:hypothetical protein
MEVWWMIAGGFKEREGSNMAAANANKEDK